MATKKHTIGKTEFTYEVTQGNKGLTVLTVNGKRVDNWRKMDTGFRPGSFMKSERITEEFKKKYRLGERKAIGKGNTPLVIPVFPLSTKEDTIAKALIEFHFGESTLKKEAKAEAKAKAEAAKATKAEATKAEAK